MQSLGVVDKWLFEYLAGGCVDGTVVISSYSATAVSNLTTRLEVLWQSCSIVLCVASRSYRIGRSDNMRSMLGSARLSEFKTAKSVEFICD